MRTKAAVLGRFGLLYGVLGLGGVLGAIWILHNQGAGSPLKNYRAIHADFQAADGVKGGIGQPVNVAGVEVGKVQSVELIDGDTARVRMEIQDVEHVDLRSDAKATLVPITPLKDMEVDLDPGTADRPLGNGATIPISRTSEPVPLSDLLSQLDEDTRTFLGSLIANLDGGTRDRSDDLRKMLGALGPTTKQAGELSEVIASRDRQMRRLVTNLGAVTRAASQDGRLATLVSASNQMLGAVARQEQPLRAALPRLAPTLSTLRSTLTRLKPFSEELGPTVEALLPATGELTPTLKQLDGYAGLVTEVVRKDVRPLVSALRPTVREAGKLVPGLRAAMPNLTGTLQTLNYFLNMAAYNPEGDDEGFLFWAAWFAHNVNSTFSLGDAHGAILRTSVLLDCQGLQNIGAARPVLDPINVCRDK